MNMNLNDIKTGILNLLMLFENLSKPQIDGLCSLVNPHDTVSLDLNQLRDRVATVTDDELEDLINKTRHWWPMPGQVPPIGKTPHRYEIVQFAQLYHLFFLQNIFQTLSYGELMKVFELVPTTTIGDLAEQNVYLHTLQDLKQLLILLDPGTLEVLATEIFDISQRAPGTEKEELHQMVQLNTEHFYLYLPLLKLLQLGGPNLLQFQNSFVALDNIQLMLLTQLLSVGDNVLDYVYLLAPETLARDPFFSVQQVPGMVYPIQNGIYQTYDPNAMHMDDTEHQEETIPQNQPAVTLTIIDQPPEKCVYKRNIKQHPSVSINGNYSDVPGSLYVAPVLIRCDTFEREDSLFNGNEPVKITSNRIIEFKRLKILATSNQTNETLFGIKFELRMYNDDLSEYEVIHEITSTPVCVVSHSTQLKPTPKAIPKVVEVVPFSGNPNGSTRVAILGSNFVDSPNTRVRFDSIEVCPIFHGSKTLICLTPAFHSSATVQVQVCNDANIWSKTYAQFTYDANLMNDGMPANTNHGYDPNQEMYQLPTETIS
eukprot:TRINITY_DN1862_c0_g1_i1.p1 TRINITY_DN1862_c0_g1~~TRINITY_DN1862_c0_g1_i1.p1  ORF type:complete len:541 (-),score=80.86 TRINITY_DN1862_c0_g1_i1:114-1736(-)